MGDWLATSYMARKGVTKGKAGATRSADRGQAGQVPLRLRSLCRSGVAHQARRHRRRRDQGRVRGCDHLGRRPADRAPEHSLPQPAMRADRGRGGGEGRRARRPHPLDQAARPAARRHLGADPGIRRSGRHRQYGAAQRPAAGEGHQDGGDRAGHPVQRKITLPYEPFIGTLGVRPRSRRSPRCSRTITAATWTCRTWPRCHRLLPGAPPGRLPLPRRLPRHAGRRRAVRRRGGDRSTATSRST